MSRVPQDFVDTARHISTELAFDLPPRYRPTPAHLVGVAMRGKT